MQLIVGDKRVNVTMRAKGAMIVIIALKGEELIRQVFIRRYIVDQTSVILLLWVRGEQDHDPAPSA